MNSNNRGLQGTLAAGPRTLVAILLLSAVLGVAVLLWHGRAGHKTDGAPAREPGLAPADLRRVGPESGPTGAQEAAVVRDPGAGARIGPSAASSNLETGATTRREPSVQAISVPAVPPTPGQSVSPSPGAPQSAAEIIAVLKDASRPIEQREKTIADLARKGDEDAVRTLKAIADADIHLNFAAVRALGGLRDQRLGEEAAAFLLAKFRDPDSRIVCESLRSYGQLLGEKAVTEIVAAIQANRERDDGHQDIVANAGVKLLGQIAAPRAVPFLRGETERAHEKNWNLEYGSELVLALDCIGTTEALKAISGYADRLSTRIPADPLAKKYFEEKIAQAREAARR